MITLGDSADVGYAPHHTHSRLACGPPISGAVDRATGASEYSVVGIYEGLFFFISFHFSCGLTAVSLEWNQRYGAVP